MRNSVPAYEVTGLMAEKISLPFLCTFTFNKKTYVITSESEGEFSCYWLRWNPLFGHSIDYGDDFDAACDAANILLERSESAPDKFPLHGEHYITASHGKRWHIKRQKRCFLTGRKAFIVPYIVQVLAVVLLSAGYVWCFLGHPGVSYPSAVFTSMARLDLIRLMYTIGIAGSLLLLALRKGLRGIVDLFFVVIIPMNIVAAFALCRTNTPVCIIITVLSLLILSPYVFGFVYRLIKRRKKKPNLKKSLKKAVSVCFGLLCVVSVVALSCTSLFNVQVYISKSDDTSQMRDEIFKSYASACKSIESKKWKTLTPDERLNVLQAITDYECTYLFGIDPPRVYSGMPASEYVLGYYSRNDNTIVIEREHLEKGEAVVVINTILHESRHAYQRAVVALYDKLESQLDVSDRRILFFRDAEKFRDSFDNYTGSNGDYSAYSGQYVEQDSRSYAKLRLSVVYEDYIYPDKKT